MNQEFQAVDTTVVQVRSVLNFMYTLGYVLDSTAKTGRFVTEVAEGQANRWIGVRTAIKMHNKSEDGWEVTQERGNPIARPKGISLKSGFSPIGVRLAIASKLVEKVKISVTRIGGIVTQDVMVKPLNAAVLQLVEG